MKRRPARTVITLVCVIALLAVCIALAACSGLQAAWLNPAAQSSVASTLLSPAASSSATSPGTPTATPRLSASPTGQPSPQPTPRPTAQPTPAPTAQPTPVPTAQPTPLPTAHPTPTAKPTSVPTPAPILDSAGVAWYGAFADPRTITPSVVADPAALDVLVNKFWQLPDGYVPSLVSAASSASQKLRPEAAAAWDALREACRRDTGSTLYLISGYRSYEKQKAMFDNALQEKGLVHTITYYAYPGRSEHQLGLALDLGTTEKSYMSGQFAATAAGQWLAAHACEFGFILRYPTGREPATNYGYEAWHYRYLGVETAMDVCRQGIAFDEYAHP
jgi:zinc D-Ala-D-Ala carboxypeptidase